MRVCYFLLISICPAWGGGSGPIGVVVSEERLAMSLGALEVMGDGGFAGGKVSFWHQFCRFSVQYQGCKGGPARCLVPPVK